jgi:predicted nucleic acid-binding protein
MRRVCLDANIWIKVLTEEPDTPLAHALVARLFRERAEIVAPSLMKLEVGSILRKKWSRRLLSEPLLNELWRKFVSLPIRYVELEPYSEQVWHIAEVNRLVHLYDAVYVAVSEGAELWTADERLVNALQPQRTNTVLKLLQRDGIM